MTYEDTIDYLFTAAPLFQHIGGSAYKEGLATTLKLDEHFNHPHLNFKTIHVGGTNGKGSTAHTIATILQHAGYKVGLFTSPHLIDFRERIRVNGQTINKQYVIDFVEKERSFFEPLNPSFFELTTALAFKYFSDQKIDIAVIEVGLGGRLDCTNIIIPILSIITNISYDHTQFLGNSLETIAKEKAGIIKQQIPVIIGENIPETYTVFKNKAIQTNSPIIFAEESNEILSSNLTTEGLRHYNTLNWGEFDSVLIGDCQLKNANTILHAASILKKSLNISTEDIQYGFRNVCEITGLQGRWQLIQNNPKVICDAGHNAGGWIYLSKQLKDAIKTFNRVHIIFGVASDKDISTILKLLPQDALYYWTKASVRRALNEKELEHMAEKYELKGNHYSNVKEAYQKAISVANPNDFIYVGGSCFIVADLLSLLNS